VSVPPVAIELNTDITAKTASAYEAPKTGKVVRSVAHAIDHDTSTTEQRVRQYFADIPVMISIARCESGFQQIDPVSGNVQRGVVNPSDLGVMQINEYYHSATADRLDLNLYKLEGNMAYARYLYKTQGTQPWSSSRACWGNTLAVK
jgi:hypothetical protein